MSKSIMLFLSSAMLTVACTHAKKPSDTNAASPSPAVSQAPKVIQAPAPDTTAKAPEHSMTCKRDSEVRTMQIEDVQPKGCKLMYSRLGKTDDIASSTKSPAHCKEVKSRIQKKLEDAGFKCTEGSISESESKPAASVAPAAKPTPVPSTTATPAAPTTTTTQPAKK